MNIDVELNFFLFRWKISIRPEIVRFSVVVLVVLASTIVAYWGTLQTLIVLLGLLGSVFVVLILLRQPNLGFILLFLGGMFVRITGPSELSAATVMIAIMLGLWIIDMLVAKKKIEFIRSPVMVPIFTFLVITALAFFVGQIPWFVFARQAPIAAQVGGFAVFVFSVGGMLLSAHLIKDVLWLKIVTVSFIVLSAVYILSRVLRIPILADLYHTGFAGQSMFWTWLVALLIGQLLYNNQMTLRMRALLFSLLALTFYVAIAQGYEWKSGWVPPIVAVVALLGIRYRKLVVFVIPLLISIAIYVTLNLIAADDYSWGTRVDAWRIILEITRVSPLVGMGFANYYWYTPLFPIRGWSVNFNSHSQFVDLIAQTGYLGLLAFLWLFFALARLSWTVARRLPDGFARGYSYGVLAGIFATLIAGILGDWVLPFVYNVGLNGFRSSILPWIFIGGVIALEQMLRNPSMNTANKFS